MPGETNAPDTSDSGDNSVAFITPDDRRVIVTPDSDAAQVLKELRGE